MRGVNRAAAAVFLVMLVGLPGCASQPPTGHESARPVARPQSLPPSANGIAYVQDGSAFVVRDGSAREVAANGARKVAVGYAADGSSLLVTEERGTHGIVLMVPADGRGGESVVLESADASTLGSVRALSSAGPLYHTVYGAPANRLIRDARAPGSEAVTLTLQGTFSGEFDVDVAGECVVYTGSGQYPASVILRTAAESRPLVAGFATAFAPSFSPDGTRVCFTGSERAGEPIAIWVTDRNSGKPQALAVTADLKPTYPVFSPDGARIAFRSAADGSIWVISVVGGRPQKLVLEADDAPISW